MLNRLALRIATVRALRGKTFAGNNVRDSELAPVDDVAAVSPRPVIIVYTDDGKFAGAGRDLFSTSGDSRVDVGYQHLLIETLITQRMQMRDDDGELIDGTVPPVLDAALALNLDLMERQVVAALMDTSPDAEWAEMWRGFALDVGDRDSQLGSSMRDGIRFAGRQMKLSVKLPREPRPGDTIGPLWTRFLALAAGESDLEPVVGVIQSALVGAALDDWLEISGRYGLTRAEARAMQIAPPAAAEDDPPTFSADVGIETTPVVPIILPID